MTTPILTRKQFLRAGLALTGAPMLIQGCSSTGPGEGYEAAVHRIWRPAEIATGDARSIRRELVRYATLAPSSHNTQCWNFRLAPDAITVVADLSRRTPAVDPDDHHLHVSLGCAVENLVQAALAHGLRAEPHVDSGLGNEVRVGLEPTRPVASPLFRAIPVRQCTRAEFDGQPVSAAEMRLLEQAGTGRGVDVLLLPDKARTESVLEYIQAANSAQIGDAAFVAELKDWIRFGADEAVRTGDGLYSAATGNPSVPRWLGSALFRLLFTAKGENEKVARQVRSSAGVAVFISADAKQAQAANWVEVGRAYERFALQAAALGIRNAFLNQPVEVAALRSQFASSLGAAGRRPDLVVRFGRGPEMPRSLRRPLEAVLPWGAGPA
jgi:hypothetical protein